MWINVEDKMPKLKEKCWYFFQVVGWHKGYFDGFYVDEEGKEWKGMHIFVGDNGGWLMGDVTHWHPYQDEEPELTKELKDLVQKEREGRNQCQV